MSDIQLTLDQYKSASPTIFAFKIASIVELADGRTVLAPEGDKFLALIVNEAFTQKYKAQVGDYFVATPNGGAQSIMSAEYFEDSDFGFARNNVPVQ